MFTSLLSLFFGRLLSLLLLLLLLTTGNDDEVVDVEREVVEKQWYY